MRAPAGQTTSSSRAASNFRGGSSFPMQALRKLGQVVPGIIAGAADLDPAAVMTAVVAGASFGTSIAWVVVACVPVLWAVFSVSSRVGEESRRGLVELIRSRYGHRSAYLMAVGMVAVNMAMIIADLRAVADAFALILRQSRDLFLAVIAFTVWWILIRGEARKIIRALAWLAVAQLAYIGAAVLATNSFQQLALGILVPHIRATPDYAIAVVALFGSLLTPDVIVWQTSSRRDVAGADAHTEAASQAGTFVAALISLSALVASSALHVSDASGLTTRTAAEALSPLGSMGPILFSLGIIGSGLVALPILVASMSFSIAEAAGWESGLSKNPWDARSFYVLLTGAAIVAVLVNYASVNTVQILYFSQIVAGMLTIPILWYVLRLANDRKVMTKTNSVGQNFWLGGAIGGTIAANAVFLWTLLR